jgi:glycosyltransferase involved in cell wall biosynthesis
VVNFMARQLRIAHVDAERDFSGGEVQVFLLIDGLAQRGHDNLLICPPGSAAEREARRRGMTTFAAPMRGDADLIGVVRVMRHLRGAAVDLVHLHTGRAAWIGGLAARGAGVPAIVTRRMDRPVRRGWRTQLLYRHLTRRTVAISPAVAECLIAGGVSESGIRLIPSAVDPARVRARQSRDDVRRALAAAPDECVVLAISALVRRKGLDVLIEAAAALRDGGLRPVLWIAGDGEQRAALEAQVQRLGVSDQIRMLGQRDDIGDLLAGCDLFVLPSRREGLGIAALEAMAAGRPVIASAVGGLGDAVVHERTGLLVPPGDAPALAAALSRLLSDRTLRERLGAAGPARVAEGFRPEQMVEAYERLYREVLE